MCAAQGNLGSPVSSAAFTMTEALSVVMATIESLIPQFFVVIPIRTQRKQEKKKEKRTVRITSK